MGIRKLWPVVTKAIKPTSGRIPDIIPAGPHRVFLVDLFGSFFTSIRYFFATNPGNIPQAIAGIHRLLTSRFAHVQANVEIYVDGHRITEKAGTSIERFENTVDAVISVEENIVLEMEQKAEIGRAVSKARHGRCERQLWQAYSLTFADRRSIETGLRALGWTVFLADGEADLAIEKRSSMIATLNPAIEPVVVSGDSDFLIYPNVRAIYRPTSNQEFLFYDVAECWDQLGLSRAKLTALGIVCHNDYSENIYGFAVATNLSIIKNLDEGI